MDDEQERNHRAEKALHEFGTRNADGKWWFSSPAFPHSEQSALAIAEACLLLDMPITDVLTPQAWLRLLDLAIRCDERLLRLEAAQRQPGTEVNP